ncbi:MAG: hypothetical protein IT211_03575 [Armatimonadetes bacterium]|nr:hypothetical protein [Armatimonadota bacterium]
MRFFLPLFFALVAATAAQAQKQYNVWYFGDRIGVDFNGGTPVARTDGQMIQPEGPASICNPTTGELLFYTDGISVWNRLHQYMPNGAFVLHGSTNTTQSALIVPLPNDSLRYLIFTADDKEDDDQGIEYGLVDMSLDVGYGDLVFRNRQLLIPTTEKLVAVTHSNGCDVWVIAHGVNNNWFYAWLVDRSGTPSTPVISKVGSIHPDKTGKVGYLKASPDGTKLVAVISGEYLGATTTRSSAVDLLSFNALTGEVGFIGDLPAEQREYGASFSPDNSKLYIIRSGSSNEGFYQYDLSSGDLGTIISTKTYISNDPQLGTAQIGPDGKLYITRNNVSFLAAVENPNAAGLACGYNGTAVPLGGRIGGLGLPNNIDALSNNPAGCKLPIADFSLDDTTICLGGCVRPTDRSRNEPTSWQWRAAGGTPSASGSKDPGTICFDQPGDHTITLTVTNQNGVDVLGKSITVKVLPSPAIDAGPDTTICFGKPLALRATQGASYVWTPTDGLSCATCPDPVATPAADITYYVTGTDTNGCTGTDSIRVRINQIATPTITPSGPVVLCAGDSITLTVNGNFADYQWSNNARGRSITVSTAGDYTATVTDTLGCVATSAPVQVTVLSQLNPTITPNGPTIFCEGDSVLLSAPSGFQRYRWTNGDTTASIVVRSGGSYGLTVGSGNCEGAATPVEVMVHPSPNPVITASGPLSFCDGDSVVLDAGAGFDSYLWTNGETSQTITVRSSGSYAVTATNGFSCKQTSATVEVTAGEAASATIGLPTVQAVAGERVKIPIEVRLQNNLARSCVAQFTATIRFNRTLLHPVGSTPVGTVNGMDRIITVKGSSKGATTGGALTELEFIATLGNATSTPLRLESLMWDRGSVATTVEDGLFQLAEICAEGGTRLIDASGSFGLKPVRPNPAAASAELEYSILEPGRTRLLLTDPLGRPALLLIDGVVNPGTYITTIDLQGLPAGLYTLTLQTLTQRAVERVVVYSD